jgi:hypothetical protein
MNGQTCKIHVQANGEQGRCIDRQKNRQEKGKTIERCTDRWKDKQAHRWSGGHRDI